MFMCVSWGIINCIKQTTGNYFSNGIFKTLPSERIPSVAKRVSFCSLDELPNFLTRWAKQLLKTKLPPVQSKFSSTGGEIQTCTDKILQSIAGQSGSFLEYTNLLFHQDSINQISPGQLMFSALHVSTTQIEFSCQKVGFSKEARKN